MPGQDAPYFLDGFYQCITELLILKMSPHFFYNALPEFIAAFLVNRFVADDCQFVSTRHDKNEHRIALARLVHTEPMKLPLCCNERITIQFATQDQNANLTGGPGLRLANRLINPIVLEFAEEFPRSHLITNSILHRLRRNFHRHR